MTKAWQSRFRLLRDQFLFAARKNYQIKFAIVSVPDLDSYNEWHKQTIVRDIMDAASSQIYRDRRLRKEICSNGTIWGEKEGVDLFHSLVTEAGPLLPIEYIPSLRLFPSPNEPLHRHPDAIATWSEFLFVACRSNFDLYENSPTKGSRVAIVKGNPFSVAAKGIEHFLIRKKSPQLDQFNQLIQQCCPWLRKYLWWNHRIIANRLSHALRIAGCC